MAFMFVSTIVLTVFLLILALLDYLAPRIPFFERLLDKMPLASQEFEYEEAPEADDYLTVFIRFLCAKIKYLKRKHKRNPSTYAKASNSNSEKIIKF